VTVLGDGDAVLATCDDAGNVVGAGGTLQMIAAFVMPEGATKDTPGAGAKRMQSRVNVTDAGGAPAGSVTVRGFGVGPFKKRLELLLVDAAGTEVGELTTTEKKAREFAVTCGGAPVARLAQTGRDRSIARTVERWTLTIDNRPAAPGDVLAAAAILRFNKFFSELSAPGPG
jgi:hypothetical protein